MELKHLLRPAGAGIHTVSTGKAAQEAMQRRIYGDDIEAAWERALASVPAARVLVLGVPSDVGAGFRRGANFGPQALREALLRYSSNYRADGVVDLGDVPVIPHLLHDSMLSAEQLAASRLSLYGSAESRFPVSPLSIAELVLRRCREVAPDAVPLLLGGDHSVGWPGIAAVAAGREQKTGIVHFDAHTDLMEHRLGVRYCFATWAFHANELIGRRKRLAQFGLRISSKDRSYWETNLDVRQVWVKELRARGVESICAEVIENFERAGVEGIYVSNDIDGTDPAFASATGTPEPGGLTPDEVEAIIRRIAGRFAVWGSDLVEVAPTLREADASEPERTLETAARYIDVQLEMSLRVASLNERG